MIEKHCDFTELKKQRGKIDWKGSVGLSFPFIYGNISGNMKICDYKRDKSNDISYVLIEYDDNKKWFNANNITGMNFARFIGHKANYQNTKKRKSIPKYKIGDIINNKYQKIKIVGTGLEIPKNGFIMHGNPNCKSQIVYYCLCGKCRGYFKKTQSQLSDDSKCPICDGKITISGINDITTTSSWMIDYFENGIEDAKKYCANSNKKIIPKCPICGKLHDKPIGINAIKQQGGFNCKCLLNKSYPENFISCMFDQLKINYISQYMIEGKLFDFYLKDFNTIVEAHGIQHYEECGLSKLGRTLEEEQKNDELKLQIAINNKIENYIVIDCRYSELGWIKTNILNSNLLKIIGKLEHSINWEKCNSDANYKSKYNVCKDYMDNLLDIDELCKKYKRSRPSIIKYLITGQECGWCNYFATYHNSFFVLVSYMKKPLFYTLSISEAIKILSNITDKYFNINNVLYAFHNNCSYLGFQFSKTNEYDNKFIMRGIGAYETLTHNSDLSKIKNIIKNTEEIKL